VAAGTAAVSEFDTTGDDVASDVALQADGKIVVAGSAGFAGEGSDTTFALARYGTNGTLDSTFGGNGKVATGFAQGPAGAYGVAIQADRKIVAVGGVSLSETDIGFALARYLAG
jgi:uncharacterized delta-60 repeat protein